jgi:hypothetical protein
MKKIDRLRSLTFIVLSIQHVSASVAVVRDNNENTTSFQGHYVLRFNVNMR